FIQTTGNFSQTVNFANAGTYTVNFLSAFRNASAGVNDFRVVVDGTTTIGTFTPTTSATYLSYSTTPFAFTAGPHTITFQGQDTLGGDRTSFVDNITITPATAINTNVIPDTSAVTVAAGATLDLVGNNETIGSLTGTGAVTLGVGTLTTGANGTS